MHRPLLLLALAGCAGVSGVGGDTGSDVANEPGDASGIVFKGPMEAGSRLTFQPLDDALEPVGDPVQVEVADELGSYTVTLEHEGPVRIDAEGLILNEAHGEKRDEVIFLRAYGFVEPSEGESSLHVNALTDLSHLRVKALVAEGLDIESALDQAHDELLDAFDIGVGERPEVRGHELHPYAEGFEASWLFAASSVLAQAGRDAEQAGAPLPQLMEDLRHDFGEDGALNEISRELIYQAEERLNPDLATLSLGSHLDDHGPDRTLPNPHPALDSDHDGIVNIDDNCRYVANPDQQTALGASFGAACDTRARSISTTDEWGCAVMDADASVRCWEVQGAPTGGTAPAPDRYPAHQRVPWAGGGGLDGRYDQVALASGGVFCGLEEAGGIDCWLEDRGLVELDGPYTQIDAAPGFVCGKDTGRMLSCQGFAGEPRSDAFGPIEDFAVVGDGVVALMPDGSLEWVDSVGPGTGEALPEGAFLDVDGHHDGPGWGCAVRESDGGLACWGGHPLASTAPTDTGFVEVMTGDSVACAVDAAGAPTCWRDEAVCPPAQDDPPFAVGLTADSCQVCGVDEDGLGLCWPLYWNQRRAQPPE